MSRNPIDDLFDELDLVSRMLTLMVVKNLHPEWSMRRVSESLENPEELKNLLIEVSKLESGSIDDLPGL